MVKGHGPFGSKTPQNPKRLVTKRSRGPEPLEVFLNTLYVETWRLPVDVVVVRILVLKVFSNRVVVAVVVVAVAAAAAVVMVIVMVIATV